MSKTAYKSDVQLGKTYRDEQTGYEGVATAISFYQHGCERVSLETYDAQRREVKSEVFDSPRLVDVKTLKKATSDATGGPRESPGQKGILSR